MPSDEEEEEEPDREVLRRKIIRLQAVLSAARRRGDTRTVLRCIKEFEKIAGCEKSRGIYKEIERELASRRLRLLLRALSQSRCFGVAIPDDVVADYENMSIHRLRQEKVTIERGLRLQEEKERGVAEINLDYASSGLGGRTQCDPRVWT